MIKTHGDKGDSSLQPVQLFVPGVNMSGVITSQPTSAERGDFVRIGLFDIKVKDIRGTHLGTLILFEGDPRPFDVCPARTGDEKTQYLSSLMSRLQAWGENAADPDYFDAHVLGALMADVREAWLALASATAAPVSDGNGGGE